MAIGIKTSWKEGNQLRVFHAIEDLTTENTGISQSTVMMKQDLNDKNEEKWETIPIEGGFDIINNIEFKEGFIGDSRWVRITVDLIDY